jgi:DNA-directed RNA polymerase specialized sigma24 family protein
VWSEAPAANHPFGRWQPRRPSVASRIVLDEVFAAAHAACQDVQAAADVTRRVLLAKPANPEVLGVRLAASHHVAYAGMEPGDRDAVALARVLGWKADEIACELDTTPQDIRIRLARGLRTLLPPRDCAAAASPAHAVRVS